MGTKAECKPLTMALVFCHRLQLANMFLTYVVQTSNGDRYSLGKEQPGRLVREPSGHPLGCVLTERKQPFW